jgi:hypothetical protein
MQSSDPLEPPWPDLVITVGRRHAMAALWIKAQNPDTRIVLIGRPRRWIDRFDLVITAPYYRVPDQPNVMPLTLPLIRADKAAVARESDSWQARLAPLRRPILAVLVGGPTRPYRFDEAVTADLIATSRRLQERYGGTLYISTSRRTPAAVVATLRRRLPEHAVLHEWTRDDQDNPYRALLGLADYFVVTGDSVSMMMEVADCGKPLAIFPLPADWRGRIWKRFMLRLHGRGNHGAPAAAARWFGRLLYVSGIAGFARDLDELHRQLVGQGFAVWSGETFKQTRQALPEERAQVCERIKALLHVQSG